jgi:uncharacterized protein
MQTLLVFLKYPEPGRVKTRLAGSIGPQRAAELYRQWIEIVFSRVQPLRGSTRVVACYDGAPPEAFDPWHASADDWWAQPPGDLGIRLDSAFRRWQTEGHPAAAIGTDCLDLEPAHVLSAFDLLKDHDAVFGPADDGGYYLVGLARYLPDFFDGIPWSTPEVFAAHRSRCEQNGWSFGLLPTLADIDTLDDYQQFERRQTGQNRPQD